MSDPIATVTDSLFAVNDFNAFTADFAAHRAIQEWVTKHGIDPKDVGAYGPIHRDEEHCRVVYVGLGEPPDYWITLTQQGETPPMPWRAELDRYRARRQL